MTAAPPPAADPAYLRSLDCVHCGLCLEACPTYKQLGLETDSPRGRLYLMRGILEGEIDDPEAVRPYLDRCLGCRACESVCPSGVRYGEVLETIRARLPQAKGWSARLRRFGLWHLVARQGRLRWAFRFGRVAEVLGLRKLARLLRLLPRRHDEILPPIPPGAERRPLHGTFAPAVSATPAPAGTTVQMFTGCVMEQMFGRINHATKDLLVANGFTVEVPKTQRCCGALLLHDGQADRARELARANLQAFTGDAPIVVNSAGCGAALREYGHLLGDRAAAAFGARVRDVSEVLVDAGLPATPAPFPHRVAYDDPCHLCHAQGVRSQPRTLLRKVPGLVLVDHADPEECCGSAGIYNLVHQDMAKSIGDRKVEALLAAGAEVVATGNPGCMMQIGAQLRAAGSAMRVVHPVELLLPPPEASA